MTKDWYLLISGALLGIVLSSIMQGKYVMAIIFFLGILMNTLCFLLSEKMQK